MHVVCPGCSTRYALPEHLLGPTGARVCCPSCWVTFLLDGEGALTAVLGPAAGHGTNGGGEPPAAPEIAGAHATDPAIAPEDLALARDELRALDEPPGTLALAARAGRLFAEHGPALLDRFEALEPRLGNATWPVARAALIEVTGIDLSPPADRGEA